MHTHGVNIFNRTDDDAIVGGVAHHFHFIFFPAENRLFNQHFGGGRRVETRFHDVEKFIAVIGNAAASAAERKRGADDAGQTDGQHAFVGFDHGAVAVFFLPLGFAFIPFPFEGFEVRSLGFALGVEFLVAVFFDGGIGQF